MNPHFNEISSATPFFPFRFCSVFFLAWIEIWEMAEAYKGVQYESLKQMYSEREKLLSINPRENLEELRTKLKDELAEQNKQLQVMVNGLVSENIDLKKRVQKTEEKLAEMERLIKEALAA